MRAVALFIILAATSCSRPPATPVSRLDLRLEQRLDLPQKVAPASIELKDFVGFIGTSFKVPLLVETSTPDAEVRINSGMYSARQLLDAVVAQLINFEWRDEAGVAHMYEKALAASPGNLLNVRIPHFAFPRDVGEFMFRFRPCISSVIQGYGCVGGVYIGLQLPKLKQGRLPEGQIFDNVVARDILLAALKTNGRFSVLIAFPSNDPNLKSDYPFANWFAESLEQNDPSPIWIQPVEDEQTVPVRSSKGFTAILKMHSEDDHGKNTHLCAAEYTLQIVRPDGSSMKPLKFGYSDDDWDRPLLFRVEGFSPDGHHAFVFISEGSYPEMLETLEYDMKSVTRVNDVFLDQHFTQGLTRECAATLHIVGTSRTGRIVLNSEAKDGCSSAELWELGPNEKKGGRVLPEYPRHLSSTAEITKIEAGVPVQP